MKTADAEVSQWHSIRPWIPRLSLDVREITSVSATFILAPPQTEELDPALASLVDDDDDYNKNERGSPPRSDIPISDVLGKGVTVKVNGAPWQRFIMRVDEEGEEAIIILYGLMPGRQYDVELGIAAGEDQLRGQVTTETHALADRTNSTDSDASVGKTDISSSSSSKPIASGGTNTPPISGSPPTVTLEERVLQLQQTLTMLNNERDSLNMQLKTARREAQKADASLRSEIEILKRSSEKHVNSEHRSKQKVLALQESVKQTIAAAQETEAQAREVETQLPQLRTQAKKLETEQTKLKTSARKSQEKMEDALRSDKKRTTDLQSELTVLTNRLEKLKGKKEKITSDTIPELEQQLAALGLEIVEVEKDPYGYTLGEDPLSEEPTATHPHPRGRYSTGVTRPTQPPIQRPTHGVSQSMSAAQVRPSGSTSSIGPTPQPIVQKRHTQPPLPATSTLSSRAPPFEPSQRLSNKIFGGSAKGSGSSSPAASASPNPASSSGPFDAPGTRTILSRPGQAKGVQRVPSYSSPSAALAGQTTPPAAGAPSLTPYSPWTGAGGIGAAVRRVSPSRSNSGPPNSGPPYSNAVSTAVDFRDRDS